MTLNLITFDLLTTKSIGHILNSWGVLKFHDDKCKGKEVMRQNNFTLPCHFQLHYQLYSTNPVLWTSNFLTPNLTLTKSCEWCIIWICFECWILPQFCLLEFLARSYIKSIYKCCTLDFNAIFYINYRKPHTTFIQLIWPQIYSL